MHRKIGRRPAETIHRLVVVGGGVAGLDIATRLSGKNIGDQTISVTLVDRETAYVWKPMLHTIAAGTANAGLQETVFAAQGLTHGFEFTYGEVTGIDHVARKIELAPLEYEGDMLVPERQIEYDTLVLAVGSRANDFGTPGVAEHCLRIDTRSDAITFNDQLRLRLIKSIASGSALTVGIVGGGATGVELAAELLQIANVAERYGMAGATSHLSVVLIESGPRLLAPFPEEVAHAAERKLRNLGVSVRTNAKVACVDRSGFVLSGGQRISSDLAVWAAGVKAPPLMQSLNYFDQTRSGQLVVGPDLRVLRNENIYALGDCASFHIPGSDKPIPTTAQAASQQADYLVRNLPRILQGKKVPALKYHDFGSLVSLGGFDAFGTLGRFGLFKGGFIKGKIAQLGHALLYRQYQVRLHGLWRGSLLWLLDIVGRKVRPAARLS